jgi:hypothetical protein
MPLEAHDGLIQPSGIQAAIRQHDHRPRRSPWPAVAHRAHLLNLSVNQIPDQWTFIVRLVPSIRGGTFDNRGKKC